MSADVLASLVAVEVAGLRRRAAECMTMAIEANRDPLERARLRGKAAAYSHAAELIEAVNGGAR